MDLHVLGNPVHHFFGVFGDYLTKNVLRVNSVVVSSRRLDVGGGSSANISPNVLSHYEYTQVPEIKASIKATRKYCRIKADILKKQVNFEKRDTNQFISSRKKLARNVQLDKDRVQKTTENILHKRIELLKTCVLLDHCYLQKATV